jgi:hypothetical protein
MDAINKHSDYILGIGVRQSGHRDMTAGEWQLLSLSFAGNKFC